MAPQINLFLSEIQPWLLNKARAICRDRTDAEDLVQEASERFLKTFSNVPTLPSENDLEAWLIRTMTNYFLDQCRKRKAEKEGAKDPVLGDVTVGQPPAPKPIYDNISDEDFAAVMKKLPPLLRATFELRAAGLRNREIAKKLGISASLVGKRLFDARRKLLEGLSPIAAAGDH